MRGGYPESVAKGMVAGYLAIKYQPVFVHDDGEDGFKTWHLMGEIEFREIFKNSLKSWAI